jgi:hypothetical protein
MYFPDKLVQKRDIVKKGTIMSTFHFEKSSVTVEASQDNKRIILTIKDDKNTISVEIGKNEFPKLCYVIQDKANTLENT